MSRRSKAAEKYLKDMRGAREMISPLSHYLAGVQSQGEEGGEVAQELRDILASTFRSEDGLKALMLFEKATLLSGVPNGSSDGALREMNAVRNFVLDIRRIVANV